MTLKFLVRIKNTNFLISNRSFHQANIPKGRGGRSSYSGVSATVFGPNGFVGRHVTNHLAAIGSQLLLPFRGEEKRSLSMKLMGDLGQVMFQPFTMKDREDDDMYTRELIQYSNVVINTIGNSRPYQFYSMEEVNFEWPVRLAQLVADKCDDTKLIHVTNLACNQPKARQASKLIKLQYEAECRMKEIYPQTTIVRSSPLYGLGDDFSQLLLSERWESLAVLGALPCLHGGGHDTVVQPLYVSDFAKAMTEIAQHPDVRGQTFELAGKDRVRLSDLLHFLYNLPFTNSRSYCLHDALGDLERTNPTFMQKVALAYLDFFFRRQTRPSLLPHFLDVIWKNLNHTKWISEDRFKRLHLSDHVTGEHPGLASLGIEASSLEQKLFEVIYVPVVAPYEFNPYKGEKIPKVDDVTQNASVAVV